MTWEERRNNRRLQKALLDYSDLFTHKEKPVSANNQKSGGIGFVGLLTIVFIVLKLTHVIDWSWWWVLSPLWISGAIAAAIIGLMLVVYGIIKLRK